LVGWLVGWLVNANCSYIVGHRYRWYSLIAMSRTTANLLEVKIVSFFVMCMAFNSTFNKISVISWRSVLLVEVAGENHRPVASHWQTLSYNVVSSTLRHEWECLFGFLNSVKGQIIIIKK
jgi:hypothetical protein